MLFSSQANHYLNKAAQHLPCLVPTTRQSLRHIQEHSQWNKQKWNCRSASHGQRSQKGSKRMLSKEVWEVAQFLVETMRDIVGSTTMNRKMNQGDDYQMLCLTSFKFTCNVVVSMTFHQLRTDYRDCSAAWRKLLIWGSKFGNQFERFVPKNPQGSLWSLTVFSRTTYHNIPSRKMPYKSFTISWS